jgi:hypothetical protein
LVLTDGGDDEHHPSFAMPGNERIEERLVELVRSTKLAGEFQNVSHIGVQRGVVGSRACGLDSGVAQAYLAGSRDVRRPLVWGVEFMGDR